MTERPTHLLCRFLKAFDIVKRDCLINTLKKLRINGGNMKEMEQLYWMQRAVVRTGKELGVAKY